MATASRAEARARFLPDNSAAANPAAFFFAGADKAMRVSDVMDDIGRLSDEEHHPTHHASLGLAPRTILNPAQAANGPRVKPEEDDCGWGEYRGRRVAGLQDPLHSRCHPGAGRNGGVLPHWEKNTIPPTHQASLGLDPRAILSPAQAANGPRVRPEEGDCGWGEYPGTATGIEPRGLPLARP
ncbi:hypothetical protein GCM10007913_33990 [Devosia yakushimensis]|uniref:Uncharacterized protein n=1 Tax=Devosia yakushimensis TaxID=470028 RepID=A0ABQ5UHC6_9HYPH|nr:hypothetical protein GCM10007913_33990 [Devosia yakushimensis]